MTLFNQHWIGLDGAPLTGAAPPVLRVHGQFLTRAQEGGVAHAYKLFSTVVATSALPHGYHVQHRTLRDGSRVQLSSSNGHHLVDVWPAGEGGRPPEQARGFVVRPDWDGTAVATWPDKATLVKYNTAGLKWIKWVSPYSVGKDATPTYLLDPTKRTLPPKGFVHKKETNFADVYALTTSGQLYLNGRSYKSLGAGSLGHPITVRDAVVPVPNVAWYVVHDDKIQRVVFTPIDTTRSTVFDKNVSFGIGAGSSLTYDAGVRITESTKAAAFLRTIITAVGATQVWSYSTALAATAPWVSAAPATFQQMNAPSALVYQGGYMTATSYRPVQPFVPIHDTNCLYIGSGVYGSDIQATYDRARSTINKTLSDSDSLTLYPDLAASVQRSLTIAATLDIGQGTWMVEWPQGKPGVWTAVSIPRETEKGLYGYYKTPFDGNDSPGIYAGDLVTGAFAEIGGKIEVTDSTSSTTTVGAKTIFSATSERTFSFSKSDAYEFEAVPYTGGTNPNVPVYSIWGFIPYYYIGSTLYGGWGWNFFASTGWKEMIFANKVTPNQGKLATKRLENYTVQASAKDYILFDKENETYLYVESTLTGTYAGEEHLFQLGTLPAETSESSSGSMDVTIKLKFESPQGNAMATVLTKSFAYAPKLFLVAPEDLPQNTDYTWKHATPGVASPIFIPLWFNQGLCPQVAYTTTAEAASAAAHDPPLPFVHRLIASFRLRMLFRARPMFAAIPDVPNAPTTYLPMLEALLVAHFPGLFYYELAELEALPLVLNTSSPAGLMSDIGLPHAQAHTEVYRT